MPSPPSGGKPLKPPALANATDVKPVPAKATGGKPVLAKATVAKLPVKPPGTAKATSITQAAKPSVTKSASAKPTPVQLASAAFDKIGMPLHGGLRTKSNALYLAFHAALGSGELSADELKTLGGHIRRHLKVEEPVKTTNRALLGAHVAKQEKGFQKHKNALRAFDELLGAVEGKKLRKPLPVKLPSTRFAVAAAAALAIGVGGIKGVEKAVYHLLPPIPEKVKASDALNAGRWKQVPSTRNNVLPRKLDAGPVPKAARDWFKWLQGSGRVHLLNGYSRSADSINNIMNRTNAVWRSSAGLVTTDQKLRVLLELHTRFAKSKLFGQQGKLPDAGQDLDSLLWIVSGLHAGKAPMQEPDLEEIDKLPPIVKALFKPRSKNTVDPLPSPFFPTQQTADILAGHYNALADQYVSKNNVRALKLKQLALVLRSHWLDLTEDDAYTKAQVTKQLREDIRKLGGKVDEPNVVPPAPLPSPESFVADISLPVEERLRSFLVLLRRTYYRPGDVVESGKVPRYALDLVGKPLEQSLDAVARTYRGQKLGAASEAKQLLALAEELKQQGKPDLARRAAELAKVLVEPPGAEPQAGKIHRFAMEEEIELGNILDEIHENPESALAKLVDFHSAKLPEKHKPPADAPIEKKLEALMVSHGNARVNRKLSPRLFEVGINYYNYASSQLKRIGKNELAEKAWNLSTALLNAPLE